MFVFNRFLKITAAMALVVLSAAAGCAPIGVYASETKTVIIQDKTAGNKTKNSADIKDDKDSAGVLRGDECVLTGNTGQKWNSRYWTRINFRISGSEKNRRIGLFIKYPDAVVKKGGSSIKKAMAQIHGVFKGRSNGTYYLERDFIFNPGVKKFYAKDLDTGAVTNTIKVAVLNNTASKKTNGVLMADRKSVKSGRNNRVSFYFHPAADGAKNRPASAVSGQSVAVDNIYTVYETGLKNRKNKKIGVLKLFSGKKTADKPALQIYKGAFSISLKRGLHKFAVINTNGKSSTVKVSCR